MLTDDRARKQIVKYLVKIVKTCTSEFNNRQQKHVINKHLEQLNINHTSPRIVTTKSRNPPCLVGQGIIPSKYHTLVFPALTNKKNVFISKLQHICGGGA